MTEWTATAIAATKFFDKYMFEFNHEMYDIFIPDCFTVTINNGDMRMPKYSTNAPAELKVGDSLTMVKYQSRKNKFKEIPYSIVVTQEMVDWIAGLLNVIEQDIFELVAPDPEMQTAPQ